MSSTRIAILRTFMNTKIIPINKGTNIITFQLSHQAESTNVTVNF